MKTGLLCGALLQAAVMAGGTGLAQKRPEAPPEGARPDWAFFALGNGIGISNLELSSAGGATEIVAGGGAFRELSRENEYWFILRYDPVTERYDQVFVSPPYPEDDGVTQIAVGELSDSGTESEIVIAREGGVVEIWSQADRSYLFDFATTTEEPDGVVVADVQGDQANEIILLSDDGLFVFDRSGNQLWNLAGVDGRDLTVGQMDDDPQVEIATADGNVIDALTRQVQWNWPDGFGIDVESADIDDDGKDELLFTQRTQFAWAFDVDRQLPKWSIALLGNAGAHAIAVADVDADGIQELVVGGARFDGQIAYDTVTRQPEWGIQTPAPGTTDVVVGDVDADGENEVIWGGGIDGGPDHLLVANWSKKTIEWQSPHLLGPFRGPLYGDLDGDGTREIVTAATSSGFEGGRILVFDGNTLRQKAMSAPLVNNITAIDLVDADGDGDMEVAAIAGDLEIHDFDGSAFHLIWELNELPFPTKFYACAFGDLDDDGEREVVVGATEIIYVFDYATKAEEWRSFFLGAWVEEVLLGDPDGDGETEILGLSNTGRVSVFDGRTHDAEAILLPKADPYSSLQLLELSPGQEVMVTGNEGGGISAHLFTGAGPHGYSELGPLSVSGDHVIGVYPIAGSPFVLLGYGGAVHLHVGVFSVWDTVAYGIGFGRNILILPHLRGVISAGPDGIAGFIPR